MEDELNDALLAAWPNCATPDCEWKECLWARTGLCYQCSVALVGEPEMLERYRTSHATLLALPTPVPPPGETP